MKEKKKEITRGKVNYERETKLYEVKLTCERKRSDNEM